MYLLRVRLDYKQYNSGINLIYPFHFAGAQIWALLGNSSLPLGFVSPSLLLSLKEYLLVRTQRWLSDKASSPYHWSCMPAPK